MLYSIEIIEIYRYNIYIIIVKNYTPKVNSIWHLEVCKKIHIRRIPMPVKLSN